MIKAIVMILAVLTMQSCVMGYPGLRDGNRAKMAQLTPGMAKMEVLAIMGDKGFGEINQPYKIESLMREDVVYEVYYYYTDYIQPYQDMDTGMTPFIFKDGKYVGNSLENSIKLY